MEDSPETWLLLASVDTIPAGGNYQWPHHTIFVDHTHAESNVHQLETRADRQGQTEKLCFMWYIINVASQIEQEMMRSLKAHGKAGSASHFT